MLFIYLYQHFSTFCNAMQSNKFICTSATPGIIKLYVLQVVKIKLTGDCSHVNNCAYDNYIKSCRTDL